MSKRIFIFGLGFTGLRLARAMRAFGWDVAGTVSTQDKASRLAHFGLETWAFDGTAPSDALLKAVSASSHILSSIPPKKGSQEGDSGGPDPVLLHFKNALTKAKWTGYFSSTGVYGDAEDDWVDETAPAGRGSIPGRAAADQMWQDLTGAQPTVFRMPGIYGPGRSAIERAERGTLSRIVKQGHVISRVHVDDIVQTVIAAIEADCQGEVFNVADDQPAPRWEMENYACDLLGIQPPPLIDYETADIRPQTRRFFLQSRKISNTKMKQVLGVKLIYPSYKEGLQGCLATRHTPSHIALKETAR